MRVTKGRRVMPAIGRTAAVGIIVGVLIGGSIAAYYATSPSISARQASVSSVISSLFSGSTTQPSNPSTSVASTAQSSQPSSSSSVASTTTYQSGSFPQFSIKVDKVFGFKINASVGYGFAVVVDLSPISSNNFNIDPGSFLKLTTDAGSNYTNVCTTSSDCSYGHAANVTNATPSSFCPGIYCQGIGLTGPVTYWLGFDFPAATKEPQLLAISYECHTLVNFEGSFPCPLELAANATTTGFPATTWVTFERDSALTGPIMVNAMGTLNGGTTENYSPDNATLHNVNVFIGTSFNGLAAHEEVPGGYLVNETIPWSYSCGPLFNNIPCGQTATISSDISDFKIVQSSAILVSQPHKGGSGSSDYTFYVTIEFPNVPYSSWIEGGGSIPITVTFH